MLPGLIDRLEKLCGDLGLGGEEIIIRERASSHRRQDR
jgi:hypothetical protein